MTRKPLSTNEEALPDPHFFPADSSRSQFDEFRSQIARYQLDERLSAAIARVNGAAGQQLLSQEIFTQPQRTQRVCSFEKDGVAYEMTLVLRLAGPTLVFSSWKRTAERRWAGFGGLRPLLGRQRRAKINHEVLIHLAGVTDDDIEDWLIYLLSGFRGSCRSVQKSVHPRNSA